MLVRVEVLSEGIETRIIWTRKKLVIGYARRGLLREKSIGCIISA
jgi:hypothetical protein